MAKVSNPARAGDAAGLGAVQLGGKNCPENTACSTLAQLDFASALIAARYRIPHHLAVVIATLASLGGRGE